MTVQLSIGPGLALGRLRRPGAGPPGSEAGPGPGPGAPALLRPPALSGAGRIGAALVLDPGDWAGAARLAFAWLRDGAPIPGAAAPSFVPGPAEDGARLAARVVAFGPGGAAEAVTPAVAIVFPQPLAVGSFPDLAVEQGTGPHLLDASPLFSGAALSFSVTGDGVSVDPATGIISIAADALVAGAAIRVVAANSGGEAELGFTLRVTPSVAPAVVAPPALAGEGRVGAPLVVDPGVWSGAPAPTLALQWLADGAAIAEATATEFVPGAAQDGAEVACRVTASNPAGAAEAETAAIRVLQAPPAASGALADVVLALGAAPLALPAAAAFSGAALRFAAAGAGAAADPATGVVTIPAEALRSRETVTVTATNSGGAATLGFAVSVLAAPAALGTPEPVAFAQGAPAATVAAAAFFAGSDLGFALVSAPAGVTIDPATGVVTVATAAAFEGVARIEAANRLGAARQDLAIAVRAALAPPAALGAPAPVVLAQGPGTATVSAQAFFAGEALVYKLAAAPAGVTINPVSGLVAIPTAAPLEAEIAVRAENAAGAAEARFAVAVRGPAATVFDAAARLAEVSFVQRTVAPSWTFDAAGPYGVFIPGKPSDLTLGDWKAARGDGRYRALVRIAHSAGEPLNERYNRSRPFGFNGRVSRDAAGNMRGVRVELDRRVDGRTSFEIREYRGRGEESVLIGGGAAAWAYGVWCWIEAEFDGPALRARIYPETAAAPGWQAEAVGSVPPEAGYYGPMSATFAGSIYPIIHIRRLEYVPLAAAAPAAPAAEDWSLEQITVQE